MGFLQLSTVPPGTSSTSQRWRLGARQAVEEDLSAEHPKRTQPARNPGTSRKESPGRGECWVLSAGSSSPFRKVCR